MTRNIFFDEWDKADADSNVPEPGYRTRKIGPKRYRSITVPAEPIPRRRPRSSQERGARMADEARFYVARAVLEEHRAAEARLDCRIRRATSVSMAGVMVLAAPPIGGAMVVLSSVREGSIRLQSQLCALGGLLVSLQVSGLVPPI